MWEWIWTWNADESTLDDAGARIVSGESWNWTWDDLPGGTVVEREATADEQAGSWSWDWSWSRELDGWAWSWAQTPASPAQPAPGSGTGSGTGVVGRTSAMWSTVVQPAAPSAPDQTTSVSASATSRADASVGQGTDPTAVPWSDSPVRSRDVQIVDASAIASQALGDATLTIAPRRASSRSLVVVGRRRRSVSVDQTVVQLGDVDGAGVLEQWAGQQVDVAQLAAADAVGAQALDSGVAAEGTALATARRRLGQRAVRRPARSARRRVAQPVERTARRGRPDR